MEYLQSIEDFELDAMERRLCPQIASRPVRTLPVYYQVSGTENEKRNLVNIIGGNGVSDVSIYLQ